MLGSNKTVFGFPSTTQTFRYPRSAYSGAVSPSALDPALADEVSGSGAGHDVEPSAAQLWASISTGSLDPSAESSKSDLPPGSATLFNLGGPRVISRAPPRLATSVEKKAFGDPGPSYIASPFATNFDLDRTSDVKPITETNAAAGPSSEPLTASPSKPSTARKQPRDSSTFLHPSASKSRRNARMVAPPKPAPLKEKMAITMPYLRQYLAPEHIRTTKPAPLWKYLRMQGENYDKPPRYECSPADVREIVQAVSRGATWDYKRDDCGESLTLDPIAPNWALSFFRVVALFPFSASHP